MKGFKKYLLTLLISVSIFLVGVNYVNAEGTAGEILLTKTATKKDKEKGRSADVTLTVNANGFTTVDKTDVVLVLDRSTSMNDDASMENTKKAAKDLVNLLITDKTKDNTRAAIVTYGSDLLTSYTSNSLTNNATALKNTINSIPNSMKKQGTNVHAGLIKAEELLKNSGDDTQKIVILLSDGEPTYYIGTDNKRHGMGGSDNYENDYCSWNYRKNIGECTEYRDSKNVVMTYENNFFSTIYTTKDAYKPSTNANNKATTMKASGTKIYTIGFGNGASGNAYEFLGKVASTPTDKYRYTASDYAGLKEAFNKIVNDFTTVATNAVVTDIVPAGFQIKKGTLPAGATSIEKDGITTITWKIGDVKSTATNSLTYTVEAKEGHYGSMYTNVSATINAKSVDGNPKYGSSNSISLDFDKPYVPIPGITVNDDYYDIKQGTTFTTPVDKYILDNDKLSDLHEDENATVVDEIVLVYDDTTNGKPSNITLNQDGSFSYNATKDTIGKITYKYYVKTTVTIGNVTEIVKSNVSTITLNVIKNQTTYVINYLEKDTNKALHNPLKESGNVYDEITLTSVKEDIPGYVYDSVSIDPLVLSDNTTLNVMNIYYTKRTDLSYTVNYLEKDTNKVLNESKEVKNVKFETVINASNEIIPIDGYVFNSVNPEKLTITTGSNVINIYYTKRTDLSYTVNYLEKDTNKVLNESKEVKNVEFEKVINVSDEIIAIDGYKFVSADKNTIVIDIENNEINLYYEAVNGTVKSIYVDKDGNEISESVITEGRVGTEYKTSSKEIAKYYLVKTIGEETGSYSEEETVITYVYDLVPVTGIDMNSNSSYMFIGTFGLALVILFVRKKRYN